LRRIVGEEHVICDTNSKSRFRKTEIFFGIPEYRIPFETPYIHKTL
jgi:hypothetical protein